jgi:hypothetical protein
MALALRSAFEVPILKFGTNSVSVSVVFSSTGTINANAWHLVPGNGTESASGSAPFIGIGTNSGSASANEDNKVLVSVQVPCNISN